MAAPGYREPDYLLKVVIVGNMGVGKTCLLQRYTDNVFSEVHISTIGVDFKIKEIEVKDDKVAKLQLWDTAGQDRFKSIVSSFYRGADGLMVVYDVTDMESFEAVTRWVDEANRYASPAVVCMLVGNKADMARKRVVEHNVAKTFADRHGMVLFETSAKSSSNVDQAFTDMATAILQSKSDQGLLDTYHYQSHSSRDYDSLKLGQTTERDTGCWGGNYCTML